MGQEKGPQPAISSTQPFSSDDLSYKDRLAAALGQRDGPPNLQSTQAFASDDSVYKARLAAALGKPVGTDLDRTGTEAAVHLTGDGIDARPCSAVSASRMSPFLSNTDESTRLLFLPADPETFDLKCADVKGSHGSSGEWIDLKWTADDGSVETLRVMAVAQSVYSVACDISLCSNVAPAAAVTFKIFFDPSRDHLDLVNTNSTTTLVVGTHCPTDHCRDETRVYPRTTMLLYPGEWELSAADGSCTTRILVFPRRFVQRPAEAESSDLRVRKRAALPVTEAVAKRARHSTAPFNIHTLSAVPSHAVDIPGPSHPLVDLHIGQRVELIGSRPYERYSVERIENVSESRSSSVWRAIVSILSPNHLSVVAKVLKTTSNTTKSTATMWLREASIHSKLSKSRLPTIVQLLGLDARVHSLYLEDVGAPSLADSSWRDANNRFSGSPADAQRVLSDMASALDFIHANGVTHNDIKPANILFKATRGAVLIDFGLSSDNGHDADTLCTAGTPWYVPPEFLLNPRTGRGLPGDVWALGVVMMYLRYRLPLPDCGKGWKILAAASQADPDAGAAIMTMRQWIAEVEDERTRLGLGLVDSLVRRMTSRDRRMRITMSGVVEALGHGNVLKGS